MRLAAAIALLALAVAGCGGGPRVTETREVAPFDRIEVVDSLDVEIVEGAGDEVRVHAGKDVMDRVRTDSAGGVLRLDVVDRGIVIGPDPLGDVRVEIAASSVAGIVIDGSGDVTLDGLQSDALDLSVKGAGELDATGSVDRLTATIRGAGDANLGRLSVRIAEVTVQGAGEAHLDVSERLDVVVNGAGDVTYRGNPRVRSDIEGAGNLRHEGG
jgi:hypothetical protein